MRTAGAAAAGALLSWAASRFSVRVLRSAGTGRSFARAWGASLWARFVLLALMIAAAAALEGSRPVWLVAAAAYAAALPAFMFVEARSSVRWP